MMLSFAWDVKAETDPKKLDLIPTPNKDKDTNHKNFRIFGFYRHRKAKELMPLNHIQYWFCFYL